ncbi:hypothetical protein OsI_02770 [Oryza sativa Indica Group]|uniref:Uncharacterized protein n=2 Tax=Oryza sativa TaxID=4530 RepID=A2ZV59_ORYSJ|nr:hypothetical protein OsI_02770 [Oryza sativa Indica Group]EAZ12606.1 hypothetical protein OsJ_02514 [Oryza sativa Japonica Group]
MAELGTSWRPQWWRLDQRRLEARWRQPDVAAAELGDDTSTKRSSPAWGGELVGWGNMSSPVWERRTSPTWEGGPRRSGRGGPRRRRKEEVAYVGNMTSPAWERRTLPVAAGCAQANVARGRN